MTKTVSSALSACSETSRISWASPTPMKKSGTAASVAACEAWAMVSSPSVVTPSVSMTTAASPLPRKSLITWRTAAPRWLASLFGEAFRVWTAFRPSFNCDGSVRLATRTVWLEQR